MLILYSLIMCVKPYCLCHCHPLQWGSIVELFLSVCKCLTCNSKPLRLGEGLFDSSTQAWNDALCLQYLLLLLFCSEWSLGPSANTMWIETFSSSVRIFKYVLMYFLRRYLLIKVLERWLRETVILNIPSFMYMVQECHGQQCSDAQINRWIRVVGRNGTELYYNLSCLWDVLR